MSKMKIGLSLQTLNSMSLKDKLRVRSMIESIELSSEAKKQKKSEKKQVINEVNNSFD